MATRRKDEKRGAQCTATFPGCGEFKVAPFLKSPQPGKVAVHFLMSGGACRERRAPSSGTHFDSGRMCGKRITSRIER
jgi:hypothetical protein